MEDDKADVDKAQENGFTPLLIASQKGNLKIVKLLVEVGKPDVEKRITTERLLSTSHPRWLSWM